MKLVIISDTHGHHNKINLPKGDVLIHCGDFSYQGTKQEIDNFTDWFISTKFKYKILVAGNHDFFLARHKNYFDDVHERDLIYLFNNSVVIEGIKFWGSPYTPNYKNLAFNKHRGSSIKEIWDKIPMNTDIVITHGPPVGILDKTVSGLSVGCEDLRNRITEVSPLLHIFGHIHESFGIRHNDQTVFINSSLTNKKKELVNEPIAIEILRTKKSLAIAKKNSLVSA